MTRPARCLQVFAREPVEGRVKTRLIPALGATTATTVYRRLLARTLRAAAGVAVDRVEIWLDRAPQSASFRDQLVQRGFSVHVQPDTDLGQRMLAALRDGLDRADRVVLIGSDCPSLDAAYLERAFASLAGHDVVIGPTIDGGYILLGMQHAEPALFDNISWSTPRVLAQTRGHLQRLGLNWEELPHQRDIDVPADLDDFPGLADGLEPKAT